jgi:hypothetical protein
MFYKHEPPPPQIRTRCRNPRCAGKLKTSTDNSRDAFCCSGCEKQYYDRHCRVCETVISPQKTKPRAVCWRSHCRHEFQRHPEQYFGARYPSSPVGQISSRSAHSTGLKSDAKSGRGWRVIAGPADDLHPINLHDFPANAAVMRTGRPGSTLIKRDSFPVNIIGGYKFPNAPKVDLFEEPATSAEPEGES